MRTDADDNPGGGPSAGADPRPGSLDGGFNLLAKDLDRAFALGLSPNQAVLMTVVREQSWTAAIVARRRGQPRPEPIPATVNLARLAAQSGLNRSRLSLALKGLLAGRILARSPDGGLLVRKDYARWLDDEGRLPRFSPAQLAFIRSARRKGKGVPGAVPAAGPGAVPDAPAGAVPQPIPNGEIGTASLLQSATPAPLSGVAKRNSDPPRVLQSATPTVAKRNTDCCKAQQLHLEERACGDSLRLSQRAAAQPAGTRAGGHDARSIVELARGHFGDAVAADVGAGLPGAEAALGGRLDLYADAIERVVWEQSRPAARPVRYPSRLFLSIARKLLASGGATIRPRASPRRLGYADTVTPDDLD